MNDPAHLSEQPEAPLRITIDSARSGAVVVRLAGDLDLLTAPLFRDRLEPLIDGQGLTLVLDLSGLDFLGSAGLAELAAAHHEATERGMPIVLVAGGRMVQRPLEVTG